MELGAIMTKRSNKSCLNVKLKECVIISNV